MNVPLRVFLPLCLALPVGSAAAEGLATIESAPAVSAAQRMASVVAAQARTQAARTQGAKAMGSMHYPGTPMANAYRAYPPSCGADPLPDASGGNGTVLSRDLPLYTKGENGRVTPETVKVTLWRIACSSSHAETPYNADGRSFNAMTLLRFDRSAANEGRSDVIPTMPLVQIRQHGVDYNDAASLVRVAAEPNTVISEVAFDSPILYSTTYVLENHPFGSDWNHQYNRAFELRIDPQDTVAGYAIAVFTMPAYAPTSSTYPDASAPLFLDGYAAAQWIKSDTGDGLLVQVTEDHGGGSMSRQIVYDLLVRDLDDNPFWLVGNAPFPVGATEVETTATWLGKSGSQPVWGKAKFRLVHCNRLDVTFTPNSGLVAPVPSFSGTRSYTRLFSANGMVCE